MDIESTFSGVTGIVVERLGHVSVLYGRSWQGRGLGLSSFAGFRGCTNGLSAENPKLPKNFTFEGDLAQRILLLKGTSYKEAPQYLSIGMDFFFFFRHTSVSQLVSESHENMATSFAFLCLHLKSKDSMPESCEKMAVSSTVLCLCLWWHEQGWQVWHKGLWDHELTFFCSSLVNS